MKISQSGIDFIKSFEGLRLKAYDDGGGVWTIGYGSTKGVHKGDEIIEDEAESMLVWDLNEAEDAVNMYVDVDISQNEFDALVSLVFNIGAGAFNQSTLLRLLNMGDRTGAALQFPRWCKDNGKTVQGLLNRRNKEMEMFKGEA